LKNARWNNEEPQAFLTAILEGLICSNSGYSHFTAGERTAVTTKYYRYKSMTY